MEKVVTTELALSAAKVLHSYCDALKSCEECPLKEYFNCEREPYYWYIPERAMKSKNKIINKDCKDDI